MTYTANGPLAASQQFGLNQTDVFLVDGNGQLNVFWVGGGGAWNGPAKLGPVGLANPGSHVAASRQFGLNQTDVFLIDRNGQLNVFWVGGGGAWNGPAKLGPAGLANPGGALVASQQFGLNQTDVFLIDRNGQLNVFWVGGGGAWNGPAKLGPAGFANPGGKLAVSRQFGLDQTDVFLVDKAGRLNVFWVGGGGAWNGPAGIGPGGIAPAGAAVAASQQFGLNQTDVFLVDGQGQLNVFWVGGGGAWNGPAKLGPAGFANPGGNLAASRQFGLDQTDVFLVDKAGRLNVFWVGGGGAWNGPAGIGPGGIAGAGANVAASQQFGLNQTDVFLVDGQGNLNVFWVGGGGAWNGPGKILPAPEIRLRAISDGGRFIEVQGDHFTPGNTAKVAYDLFAGGGPTTHQTGERVVAVNGGGHIGDRIPVNLSGLSGANVQATDAASGRSASGSL